MNTRWPDAAGGHRLAQQPAQDHRRAQVDRQRAVDLRDGEGGDRPAGRQRGVGDQDVDPPASRASDSGAPGLGEIAHDRPAPGLDRDRLERVGAPAGQDERRAAGGEPARQRRPEPARRAGEEHGAPGERHGAITAAAPRASPEPPARPHGAKTATVAV